MRPIFIFLWKVVQTVFWGLLNLLFILIYVLVHFFWYFRFPESEKIKVLLMDSDYETHKWLIKARNNIGIPLMISTWPTDIHRIWNWKLRMMTSNEYESQYSNFVFFESKKKYYEH